MRNVYTLFDYGDFVASPNETDQDRREPPYLQLLSLTEPSEAHQEFVSVRLGGVDRPPRPLLNTTRQDRAANGDGKSTQTTAIAASVTVVGVVLIVACILLANARRRRLRIR